MKKTISILFILHSIIVASYAQPTINYGTLSGTSGESSSYFGYNAGNAVRSGYANSFFGAQSGRYVTSSNNTAMGSWSLSYTTTGDSNTAFGSESLFSNTTGYLNTAVGSNSLRATTSGYENTAIGTYSLRLNTTGYGNTATGKAALENHTTGNFNVASGHSALLYNSSGSYNTALGTDAMRNSTTTSWNVAVGYKSLYNNRGHFNTATGFQALYSNGDGHYNTANGYLALYNNTTGDYNVAVGYRALFANTTGAYNTSVGRGALDRITTGLYNSALGFNAGPNDGTFSNTTALGYAAVPTGSDQVRIGNSAVGSIGGQVSWSTLSDGRFKRDIKEDVSGLEFIKKLRPVSYSIDRDAVDKFLRIPDSLRIQVQGQRKAPKRQTGFVAQEVEAIVKKTGYVFHGVEAPQSESDHYSIRYAEFVVPLVKAVQELTGMLEAQQLEIVALKEQLSSHKSNTGALLDEASSTGAVLFQNNPNPFTMDTEIVISLPEQVQQATLIVYNMEGKQLKVMPILDRGKTGAKIQGQELKAGMYIYSLIADGTIIDTKRMILTGN